MESEQSGAFVPPYNIPWATFLSAVEKISADPPNRVDRSYLGSQSGNVQTYLIAALKSFGLIDQDARPARIKEFADPGERKDKVAELLRDYYPTLVALGETKATNDELREKFGEAFPGITGESRVKAIRFFLSAMTYAELPQSDLWASVKAPRGASSRSTTRKATTKKNKGDGDGAAQNGSSAGGGGDTYTVSLDSGGTVAVSVSVNIFALTKSDRDFVLDLVDKLKGYKQVTPASESKEADTP